MSSNFDSLGNDIEETPMVFLAPREIVRERTSSKKNDAPPSYSGAGEQSSRVSSRWSGNEKMIRDKSLGRTKNMNVPVPGSAAEKHSDPNKLTDRHSKTGRVDTVKKVSSGWGNDFTDADARLAGQRDAEWEMDEDLYVYGEVEPITLDDFEQMQTETAGQFEQQLPQVQLQRGTSGLDIVVNRNLGNYIEPKKSKHHKTKRRHKVKNLLELDATFDDFTPRSMVDPMQELDLELPRRDKSYLDLADLPSLLQQ